MTFWLACSGRSMSFSLLMYMYMYCPVYAIHLYILFLFSLECVCVWHSTEGHHYLHLIWRREVCWDDDDEKELPVLSRTCTMYVSLLVVLVVIGEYWYVWSVQMSRWPGHQNPRGTSGDAPTWQSILNYLTLVTLQCMLTAAYRLLAYGHCVYSLLHKKCRPTRSDCHVFNKTASNREPVL